MFSPILFILFLFILFYIFFVFSSRYGNILAMGRMGPPGAWVPMYRAGASLFDGHFAQGGALMIELCMIT